MEKLTGEQILAELKERYDNSEMFLEDFAYGSWMSDEDSERYGKVEQVYSDREGSDYDTMFTVYHFVDQGEVYIGVSGWYDSHNGTEYDSGPFLCKKETKTIEYFSEIRDN